MFVVSRLICKSNCVYIENTMLDLSLDVNTEIYPLNAGENITLALYSTLNRDGKEMPATYTANALEGTIADEYEYVCHGKVFRVENEAKSSRLCVFISCGGLIVYLVGEPRDLSKIPLDSDVYVLIKKA